MKRLPVVFLLGLLPAALLGLSATAAESAAATASRDPSLSTPTAILYNGIVVSMEGDDETPSEAIALAGERILALGTSEALLALAGPDTQRIDLRGHALYPGFLDPHTHLMNDSAMQGMTWDSVQQFALQNGSPSQG